MASTHPFLSLFGFLGVALLAGAVAGVAAFRMGLPELRSLSLAALLFLIQFGAFVLLSGLGLPAPTAKGIALALGLVASFGG